MMQTPVFNDQLPCFCQIYYETLVDIEPGTELLLGKKVPILFNKLNDSAIDNSGGSPCCYY